MKELAAYLLLVLGGNATPSSDDVSSVLQSVGISADADAITRLTEAVSGKNLDEVIAEGRKKLVSVGSGGGAAAPAAAGAPAAGAKEEKKEEKKKEEEEEEVGGAGGLFGGDDDW